MVAAVVVVVSGSRPLMVRHRSEHGERKENTSVAPVVMMLSVDVLDEMIDSIAPPSYSDGARMGEGGPLLLLIVSLTLSMLLCRVVYHYEHNVRHSSAMACWMQQDHRSGLGVLWSCSHVSREESRRAILETQVGRGVNCTRRLAPHPAPRGATGG